MITSTLKCMACDLLARARCMKVLITVLFADILFITLTSMNSLYEGGYDREKEVI